MSKHVPNIFMKFFMYKLGRSVTPSLLSNYVWVQLDLSFNSEYKGLCYVQIGAAEAMCNQLFLRRKGPDRETRIPFGTASPIC